MVWNHHQCCPLASCLSIYREPTSHLLSWLKLFLCTSPSNNVAFSSFHIRGESGCWVKKKENRIRPYRGGQDIFFLIEQNCFKNLEILIQIRLNLHISIDPWNSHRPVVFPTCEQRSELVIGVGNSRRKETSQLQLIHTTASWLLIKSQPTAAI